MRKLVTMPELPEGMNVVGPDVPEYGYLQLVRAGTERTLCDLPLQPSWHARQPEEFGKYLLCLGCLKALELEQKTC